MSIKANRIINCDCREGLKDLPDKSVNCAISSPPYWSLRDYGVEQSVWDGDPDCEHDFEFKTKKWSVNVDDKKNSYDRSNLMEGTQYGFCKKCGAWLGCLGLEPTFELYIKHLCDIYDEVKRVLRDDGTCWVNLGDTYSTQGGQNRKTDKDYSHYDSIKLNNRMMGVPLLKSTELPQKCLCMIPSRFAIEMCNRGWILRNKIIWVKGNPMPSSVRDRFTISHEYIFFFVKQRKYWFEQQFEPLKEESKRRAMRGLNKNKWSEGDYQPEGVLNQNITKERKYKGYDNMEEEIARGNTYLNPQGRNKRSVWFVNTVPNPEAHFATFNSDLITPMIKAGCPLYVCKKCGKHRKKIIDKEVVHNRKPDRKDHHVRLDNMERCPSNWKPREIKEIRYTDCGCNAGFEGGIVLDPFAGVGTTLYTAWNLGRRYIGFEISAEYCEIAERVLNKKKDSFERNENILLEKKVDFGEWL